MLRSRRRAFWMVALVLLAVAAEAAEYRRAREPWPWSFPADHGSHPQFGTEWWYFTGSLVDGNSHRWGYELTFFRVGLNPLRPVSTSEWRAHDLMLAHFAITDVEGQRFYLDERVQRAAAGLAGAAVDSLHVWIGNWRVNANGDGSFELVAGDAERRLRLELVPTRGPVLHGREGLSCKTDDCAEASYYYSMPRLQTRGSLQIRGSSRSVSGMTWMDHEFFTGASPIEGLGWDWFSIRFADGRDLMLYRVRHPEKGDHLSGTVVEPDGTSRPARVGGAAFHPLETWTSAQSGRSYPIAWRLELPREDAVLEVRALLPQQEVIAEESVGFPYWEGLSRTTGTWSGTQVLGEGYVELTGY